MQRMSFAMTWDQMVAGTKDVTRRFGWWRLNAGAVVLAVDKTMGLGRGGRSRPLYPIEILDARSEPLEAITPEDVVREGFPDLTPDAFVAMFVGSHRGVTPATTIRRFEFRRAAT